MPSTKSSRLDQAVRRTLLKLARDSIGHGLRTGRPLDIEPSDYPEPLQEQRATFVTLHRAGTLRGCIGHLEAVMPLVRDVADNAFAAAFRDPRFPALEAQELSEVHIDISILSLPQPIVFTSEQDLIRQLQPGSDGLILEDKQARGTFLPSVWDTLPNPRDFLLHLKQKAGLPPEYWSDTLTIARYHTESFGDE